MDPPADRAAVEESGTVKWYNAMKGFGFIASYRGGKDIFVHASALERAGIAGLIEGQRVAVDVIDGRKSLRRQSAPAAAREGDLAGGLGL
jgi:cold shock protein